MIHTKIYFWHDGILEPTEHMDNVGCSHLIVTFLNGVPIGAEIVAPSA